jgi:hypothetical protein
MNQRGSTTAEYIGIVVVVVGLFLALLTVRSTDLGKRAPVRPLPAIIRLIQAPMRPITPTVPRRPGPPRGPRKPRPPGVAPPPVLLPQWMGGPGR